MKGLYYFYFCLFLFPSLSFALDEEQLRESELAAAFFAAQGYSQAEQIYQQILKENLPKWQQMIVFFNLGTIKLKEENLKEAFAYYQLIEPKEITSQRLAQSWLINQGLLYLNQSQQLVIDDKDLKADFIKLSLAYFEQAKKTTCEWQKIEHLNEHCLEPSEVIRHSDSAIVQLVQMRKTQRAEIPDQSPEMNLLLIKESLDNFSALLLLPKLSTYASIAIHSGESIVPLIQNLKNSSLMEDYTKVLDAVHNQKWKQAQIATTAVADKIKEQLAHYDEKQSAIQGLLIHYYLLLSQDFLEPKALQALIDKQNDSKLPIQNLAQSLKQLQSDHRSAGKFFLYAALSDLLTSIKPKTDPKSSLKAALETAKIALQLNFLAQLSKFSVETMHQIVSEKQKQVLTSGLHFLEHVLKQEKEDYQKLGTDPSRCQEYPWKQVIPAFEKGYNEAQEALNILEQPATLLAKQSYTIIYWQQALNLLQQTTAPEQQKQTTPPPEGSKENMSEVFQLLQEMELEDLPSKVQPLKELHAW